MQRSLIPGPLVLVALLLSACSTSTPRGTTPAATSSPASSAAATALPSQPSTPAPVTLLFDTDVAADDLVAVAFLVSAPNVTLAGITVSGTGEAHCAEGVDVVLRLLDRLDAPDIPVACGRETPLAGTHEFPAAWRDHVDGGSGLNLQSSARVASPSSAVELIVKLSKDETELHVLATGPLTNLADAFLADPGLADRLGPVTIMGGALHVPGNLVCCGAPEGNASAEWNIYVDPRAAAVVVDSGIEPLFVSLDSTNHVPVTTDVADRAMHPPAETRAARLVADLFTANQFMRLGEYYLWDPLAAIVAAGYPVGSRAPATITVIEEEGTASGATRPSDGPPNIMFLADVDGPAALDLLLRVLNGG
jgi:pyrimidine-specific ribonucleoside hydrolase